MIEAQVTIVNKLGLHARAAAKLVSCASAFSSKILAGKNGNLVDGKSIMSVMMLAAGKGTVLDLKIDGADEAAALEAIRTLIANRFDEAEQHPRRSPQQRLAIPVQIPTCIVVGHGFPDNSKTADKPANRTFRAER